MNPGHLIFIVNEIPDKYFRREKNDLHYNLRITLQEALLGFEKQIKHLDDHIVFVRKADVTQPGDIIKVKGEGMPIHQSGEKGDLYIRIDIIFPTVLSEAQKLIAERLFSKRSYW
jgi:DnaJ family protein B protein 11